VEIGSLNRTIAIASTPGLRRLAHVSQSQLKGLVARARAATRHAETEMPRGERLASDRTQPTPSRADARPERRSPEVVAAAVRERLAAQGCAAAIALRVTSELGSDG
jgi:hypothetical protein